MNEQFTEIKDRAIAEYNRFAVENPKAHKNILLAARIASILYRMLLKCSERHLDNICLFLCFLLFIFLVYFVQIPAYLEITTGIIVFLVATIGVSFLDYKEKLYEGIIEEKQLEDTRKLLTLGVDRISGNLSSAPALPVAKVVQQYQPHQVAIGNTVKLLSRSNGLELEFNHIESMEKIDQYVFTSKDPIKGTGMIKTLNRIALQLQNSSKLLGLPTITANGTDVLISIHHDWIPPDLMKATP